MKNVIALLVMVAAIFENAAFAWPRIQVDAAFGKDGVVAATFKGLDDRVFDATEQPDQKILITGSVKTMSFYEIATLRLNKDGSLDMGFGRKGLVRTAFKGWNASPNAITVQPDGKIVVVGSRSMENESRIVLIRYLSDGTEDKTFGKEGRVDTILTQEDYAKKVLSFQTPEGIKLIVAATSRFRNNGPHCLIQYDEHGNVDKASGFGTNGIVYFGDGKEVATLFRKQDGKIIVGGNSLDLNEPEADIGGVLMRARPSHFFVAQLLSNGEPDTSFGFQGTTAIRFPGSTESSLHFLGVGRDERILATGYAGGYTDGNRLATASLQNDGSRDKSFGDDGILSIGMKGYQSLSGRQARRNSDNSASIIVSARKDTPDGTMGTLSFLGVQITGDGTVLSNTDYMEPGSGGSSLAVGIALRDGGLLGAGTTSHLQGNPDTVSCVRWFEGTGDNEKK